MSCRLYARALLASAAIAAAFALAGCNEEMIPTGRALAPLSDKMVSQIADKNMDKESPILIRLFKEEAELEVWKLNRDGQYALLKTYPICRWSGDLGPKKKEGDRQAPEGFYKITPAQMNPNSNYYLAFNTGFPNTYDRAHGYTGSELMVHGDCSSRGCYAMTDEQIQEIYALARDSFFGGQKEFQFEAFPFRMTALNMAKHRNNPNFAFWKMLKEGYDNFEATRQEPKVAVCEKRYVFDATPVDGSNKPLHFDPHGKCPAYQLDKNLADAILDHRRQEQFQLAKYIADGVSTVPPHVGDGGSNPVFISHAIQVANGAQAPGALPHVPNPPGAYAALHPPKNPPKQQVAARQQPEPASAELGGSEPTTLASVPVPPPAPLPKEGEAPVQKATTIAGLLDNLFGRNKTEPAETAPAAVAEAAPEEPATPVSLRGSEDAAKPKPAVYRAATAHIVPKPKPQVAPKAVAAATPAVAKPRVAKTEAPEKPETQGAGELRTAYSAPQPKTSSMLAGAQPVVPAGSFDSRWSALR